MRATSLTPIGVLCTVVAAVASADETDLLKTDPVAAAFGAAPLVWGVQLSPDGERLSQIQMHPSGISVARVVDLRAGTEPSIVASGSDARLQPDVLWCDWANNTRLVCRLRALRTSRTFVTRIFGIDSDGGNAQRFGWSQVIDLLSDDPDRVLVRDGWGLARLNVYNGTVASGAPGRTNTLNWITDGAGTPRLYRRILGKDRWFVRETPAGAWSLLHEKELTDTEDAFKPVGFGKRNELLFFDEHEGRRALFALDLEHDRSRRLVYAHETLDVTAAHFLGKHERFVAAGYIDDRPRLKFFDERVEEIHTELQARFVDKNVSIVDEDWNRRYYLVLVDGPDDPGTYYRLDSERDVLLELVPAYPRLAGRELAPVRELRYPAADGARIPAYLTMPKTSGDELPPAVVLPHDGPASRDYLRFDFLAQYLAAKGYVVLQSNYRGSTGYGDEWEGRGGYRDWHRAISDIADGTEYLAREGIADARRVCIVGWGYGGYAALMNAIESSGLYRCVVSIAGVTDPRSHGASAKGYLGSYAHRAFIGTDDDVLDAGSPLLRVEELGMPTLLFHGEFDGEVFSHQSATLARALGELGTYTELVRYEYAEHNIWQERYRIDLLTRLAAFLDTHLSNVDVTLHEP